MNAASTAIEREGPACATTLDDFLRAIEASKRAKQEVGATPPDEPSCLAEGPLSGVRGLPVSPRSSA